MYLAEVDMKRLRILASLLLGIAVGVLLHYVLYRMGLPIEPFIYMAF